MTIDQRIDGLIDREGGYVNNPADRGGPTNYGITEQVARAFGYSGDMRLMPRQVAATIYKQRYWTLPHFDLVADRYPKLAAELLDTGVNMGPKVAATFLQRALNALNRGSIDYPDIAADGDIGNLTLHALDGFKAKRGAAGEAVLLRAVECLQGCKYIAIAEANPSQEVFMYGWLANRIGQTA